MHVVQYAHREIDENDITTVLLFSRRSCIQMKIWRIDVTRFQKAPIQFLPSGTAIFVNCSFLMRRLLYISPTLSCRMRSPTLWMGHRRVVINFLNDIHIHVCASYAKQDGSSGKYLRVAADIFRENSANGSAILRSSSPRIHWLKRFTDIGLQITSVLLVPSLNIK